MPIEPRKMRGDLPLDNYHACEIAEAICERLDQLIKLFEPQTFKGQPVEPVSPIPELPTDGGGELGPDNPRRRGRGSR